MKGPGTGLAKATATLSDGALVIRVEQVPAVLAPDELLPFPFGLDATTARKLIRKGHLPAARLGRHLYAKRSDVVALVDKLAVPLKEAVPSDDDGYAEFAAGVPRRIP